MKTTGVRTGNRQPTKCPWCTSELDLDGLDTRAGFRCGGCARALDFETCRLDPAEAKWRRLRWMLGLMLRHALLGMALGFFIGVFVLDGLTTWQAIGGGAAAAAFLPGVSFVSQLLLRSELLHKGATLLAMGILPLAFALWWQHRLGAELVPDSSVERAWFISTMWIGLGGVLTIMARARIRVPVAPVADPAKVAAEE